MKDRVFKIVSQVINIPVEQLSEDSSPDTVENWDSFQQMNLVLALEEEFNLTFLNEEIVEMLSIKIIIETLKKKDLENR